MSPFLAFLLCCGVSAWLFREDMKWRRLESPALWIAGIWVAIAGSRSPTYWTDYLGLGSSAQSNLDGNPLNFLITSLLIVAALLVLSNRGYNWSAFAKANKSLCLIYFFFALSFLWGEYPSVLLRRLWKDVGCVAIVVLLLTQRDPAAAIRTIYVRVSFLLFPFSVLFYKYFPELGRGYSFGGDMLFSGVCTFKNELGMVLMVFGLIGLWDLLELRKEEKSAVKKRQVLIHYGCSLMIIWLLIASNSATSLVCLLLGMLIWWGGRYLARLGSPLQIMFSVVTAVLFLGVLEAVFDLKGMFLDVIGRDRTFSGRTVAWPLMMESVRNPLLGEGYRMFWDLHGLAVEEKTGFPFPTAHSGYVEMYLAGGLVGLALLGLFLLATGLRVAKGLLEEGSFGRLGFIFWVLLLIYNYTESSFLWSTTIWFTFLLWAIKPQLRTSRTFVSPSLSSGLGTSPAKRSKRLAIS
jgi:exopolysaccharide production protein ExoQ